MVVSIQISLELGSGQMANLLGILHDIAFVISVNRKEEEEEEDAFFGPL